MSSEPLKVDKKIVNQYVFTESAPGLEIMHEDLPRPEALEGRTYKIKPAVSDHAIYITINDMVLNAGTEHESRHPREIFINSKSMNNFQWVTALTRIVSAVWRKGGNAAFVVEELESVFDPNGGYFKKGGKFMPSLVAEIGEVIKRHLLSIGMIQPVELDAHQAAYVAEKAAQVDADTGYPSNAELCVKCNTKAVVMSDGCAVCLSCGESHCG